MEKIIHKAESRGHAHHGWLETWHTFSFANYYNPDRVRFGKLRVLNDDVIAGNMGFGLHPHDNMEIITIPLEGSLKHADNMGHEQVIIPGEVQVMSAGTGLFHSEFNAGSTPVKLLQIWIFPKQKNVKPTYNQHVFDLNESNGSWLLLVSGDGKAPLTINQDARISRVTLAEGKELGYTFQQGSFGAYLFVIEGEVDIEGTLLGQRDGVGLSNTGGFTVKALKNSTVLNIEV